MDQFKLCLSAILYAPYWNISSSKQLVANPLMLK